MISFLVKLYIYTNIYQQSFYEAKNLFKFILRKSLILLPTTFLIMAREFYQNIFLDILILALVIFQIIYFFKTTKKRLKITKRVIRLWVMVGIFTVCLVMLKQIYLLDLLCVFLIIISNVLLFPVERLISKKYLKQAKDKVGGFKNIKIAITGSYGKTSVKHYIANSLKNKYLVGYSPKSYNTPLGIAKYLNSTNLDLADFIIYEFGARRIGDIKELGCLYNFDIAVVTSVGEMHIDTFKTQENIVNEKMSLLDFLPEDGIAILNYENEFIRNFKTEKKVYSYGFDYGDYRAKNIKISIHFTEFDLYINDTFYKKIKLKLLGRQAILNTLPAIILCHLYSVDLAVLEQLESVENRLVLKKMYNYYILDDAYNSNILGAKYALEVLRSYKGEKFLITPGFAEMNSIKNRLAKNYAAEIIKSVDVCILVKNSFTKLLNTYIDNKIKVCFVKSFKEGFKMFTELRKENGILLIENDLPDAF